MRSIVSSPAWPPECSGRLAEESFADRRFRRLLGEADWNRLPAAVRARFEKKLGPGRSVTYAGEVLACRMSWMGWLLAQACRTIGAPLPLSRDVAVAAVAAVTEDGGGGQIWTRLYARRNGFPQAIHSAKRFSGPTGLEEMLGGGFGVALRLTAGADGLAFISDHYFVLAAGLRLRLPRWASPGQLRIEHADLGRRAFTFSLSLRHRLFGELIAQKCRFHDQDWQN